MADTELRMTDALICLETETEGGCKKGEEFVCVRANLGGCVISATPSSDISPVRFSSGHFIQSKLSLTRSQPRAS